MIRMLITIYTHRFVLTINRYIGDMGILKLWNFDLFSLRRGQIRSDFNKMSFTFKTVFKRLLLCVYWQDLGNDTGVRGFAL